MDQAMVRRSGEMATFSMLLIHRSDQMVADDSSAISTSSSSSMGMVVGAGVDIGVAVGLTIGSVLGGSVIVAELVSAGLAELVLPRVVELRVGVVVGVGPRRSGLESRAASP